MEQVTILRGKDAFNNGSGSGSGSGSGYGYGDGDGYGYGSGDGSGYGDGSGSGYGYGSGDGYGYGDGSGSGSGYGYGSGYGDGDGSGSGSGYGYGSGYGSGDGSYWQTCIQYFSAKWAKPMQERLQELQRAGAKIVYWCSTNDGTPANGGSSSPVKAGDVQKIAGPLEVCTIRALHGTLIPPRWRGDRWWIVALIGEVQGDDEKYGALEREILGECV